MTQCLLPYSDKRRIESLERLVRDLQRQSRRHIGITVLPNGQAYAPGGFVIGGDGGIGTITSPEIVPKPTDLLITPGADADDVWIEVEWNAPTTRGADQVASYQVRYRHEGSTGAWVATSTTDTSDRIEGLIPQATYDIEVYSVTKLDKLSQPATGQTTTLADTIPPEQVTGVTATSAIETAFVEWLPVEARDVARGGTYEVELYTDAGLTAFLSGVSVAGGTTFATIAGMVAGTQVWIRVRAVDVSNNAGPWSSTVTTTPGGFDAQPSDGSAPVASPSAMVRGGVGYLLVEWDEVANDDPVICDVHLSTNTGFSPTVNTLVASTPGTFAFVRVQANTSPLVYGTTYYARIIARDADGSAPVGVQGSGQMTKVTGPDIAVGAITAGSAIIADATIGTAQIADAAIITAKINDLAVTTAKLQDAVITNAKIGDLAVDNAKIADATIQSAKISSITADKIATGTLTAQVTLSGLISTAASGPRVELRPEGISGYAPDGTTENLRYSTADGSVFVKGRIRNVGIGHRRKRGISSGINAGVIHVVTLGTLVYDLSGDVVFTNGTALQVTNAGVYLAFGSVTYDMDDPGGIGLALQRGTGTPGLSGTIEAQQVLTGQTADRVVPSVSVPIKLAAGEKVWMVLTAGEAGTLSSESSLALHYISDI